MQPVAAISEIAPLGFLGFRQFPTVSTLSVNDQREQQSCQIPSPLLGPNCLPICICGLASCLHDLQETFSSLLGFLQMLHVMCGVLLFCLGSHMGCMEHFLSGVLRMLRGVLLTSWALMEAVQSASSLPGFLGTPCGVLLLCQGIQVMQSSSLHCSPCFWR